MFRYDPITTRPCSGTFTLSEALMRRFYSALGDGNTCLYGLRHIDVEGKAQPVGLMDPRRLELQAACAKIGTGQMEQSGLQALIPTGCGLTINSPQVFGGDDPFGELSDLFLAGLQLKDGGHPEKMYTTIYIGSYESGFGLHKDPGEDTALFVLDGTKHFTLVEDGAETHRTIEQNGYLAWNGGQTHGAANPTREWSITLNFAVGSPGVEGPVRYAFDKTQKVTGFIDTNG